MSWFGFFEFSALYNIIIYRRDAFYKHIHHWIHNIRLLFTKNRKNFRAQFAGYRRRSQESSKSFFFLAPQPRRNGFSIRMNVNICTCICVRIHAFKVIKKFSPANISNYGYYCLGSGWIIDNIHLHIPTHEIQAYTILDVSISKQYIICLAYKSSGAFEGDMTSLQPVLCIHSIL